uniref:HIT domain-containing protein n=1 Tax=Arcella intermedia TaxID=1963864 RepID=A0A6B2LQ96_9EUKA
MEEDCIFCSIIRGEAECVKITETENAVVFLDVCPVTKGHCLIVPKYHAQYLHQLPEEEVSQIGPLLVKIAKALDVKDYNVLQNNGTKANQGVPHVHFHIIPKTDHGGLELHYTSTTDEVHHLRNTAQEIRTRLS